MKTRPILKPNYSKVCRLPFDFPSLHETLIPEKSFGGKKTKNFLFPLTNFELWSEVTKLDILVNIGPKSEKSAFLGPASWKTPKMGHLTVSGSKNSVPGPRNWVLKNWPKIALNWGQFHEISIFRQTAAGRSEKFSLPFWDIFLDNLSNFEQKMRFSVPQDWSPVGQTFC